MGVEKKSLLEKAEGVKQTAKKSFQNQKTVKLRKLLQPKLLMMKTVFFI